MNRIKRIGSPSLKPGMAPMFVFHMWCSQKFNSALQTLSKLSVKKSTSSPQTFQPSAKKIAYILVAHQRKSSWETIHGTSRFLSSPKLADNTCKYNPRLLRLTSTTPNSISQTEISHKISGSQNRTPKTNAQITQQSQKIRQSHKHAI